MNVRNPVPIVVGHEASGIVTELGSDVDNIEIGDHVIPSFVASCGQCEMCIKARPALCIPPPRQILRVPCLAEKHDYIKMEREYFITQGVAAFAQYAVVSKNAVIKIDKAIPFDQAALFGCAVATGVGSIVNTAGIKRVSLWQLSVWVVSA